MPEHAYYYDDRDDDAAEALKGARRVSEGEYLRVCSGNPCDHATGGDDA